MGGADVKLLLREKVEAGARFFCAVVSYSAGILSVCSV